MPRTAFSSHYGRELDPEQLMSLVHAAPVTNFQPDADLPPALRDWIRADIVCCSCGAMGAQIVRPSTSSRRNMLTRQGHFRFVNPTGDDAHHPFCEFHGDPVDQQSDTLLDLASARTMETRWVRALVCKGIEHGMFDQRTIRAMRQWFFDLKLANRTRVSVDPDAIDWIAKLQRHPSYYRWPFEPIHAEMPGFKWDRAAIYQFTEDNLGLLELIRGAGHDADVRRRAKAFASRYDGQEVFDVAVLQPYYEATLKLAMFVAGNSDYGNGKSRWEEFRHRGAPVALLALCALLLHQAHWDLNEAIGAFARLIAAPAAQDQTLGNVMGLNPFHDYAAWRMLSVASAVTSHSQRGFDYQAQLRDIEARMREEHRRWKECR